jgi:putative Holliday junction resolvase
MTWTVRLLLLLLLPATASALALSSTPRPIKFGVRTLGVDFGLRNCGLAISSGFAPLPLRVLKCGGDGREDFEAVAKECARMCAGEGAEQVVLGMPYNSSGGEGEQANITRVFASLLADAVYPRPVFLWDERFSSQEASMRMNKGRGAAIGERVDAVAAAVILEDFFDSPDDVCAAAPLVPSSWSRPSDGTSSDSSSSSESARPRARIATPPSRAEVRRAMMERAAAHEETQPGPTPGGGGAAAGASSERRRAPPRSSGPPRRSPGQRRTDRFELD